MPLGFDNNSTMAGIITRGGDYLANQFTAIGQQLEQTLMRNRAMRETQAMGQELAQVNPATDDFPQVATLLASKYPLAMETGMGGKLLTLPSLAFKAFKETQEAQALAGKAYTLEAMREGNRIAATALKDDPKKRFLGVNPGAPAGVSNAFDQQPLPPLPEGGAQPDGGLMGEAPAAAPVPPRGRGLGDIVKGAFAASKLPSAVELQRDLEAENQQLVNAGRAPIWTEANQAAEIARRQRILQQQASQDAIATRQKEMVNLTMENRKALAAEREAEKSVEQARKDRIDAAKVLALQKDADFKRQESTLRKFEKELMDKPDDVALKQRVAEQQQRATEALAQKHKAEAAVQSLLSGEGVKVLKFNPATGRLE